jgi:hypothetical protein
MVFQKREGMINLFSKKRNLFIMGLLLVLALVGCSSGEKKDNASSPTKEENTKETTSSDSGVEKGEVTSLEFGETGTIKSTLGKFEVTVNDVEYQDSYGDTTQTRGTFVVLNLTYKNISDSGIAVQDINDPLLYDANGTEAGLSLLNKELPMTGELAPGEEVSGEIAFDHTVTDTYKLVLGHEVYSNILEWEFTKK